MSETTIESAELLKVDPATLVIGTNVRTNTHPDAKAFAKSIRERGVLEVITARRDESGELVVLRGQRRALVATEVGTPTGSVPVRVVDSPEEADRIVDQLTENLHREAMGSAEVVAGVEQLALIGVSAAQIAKRTAIKRPDVDAALVVAKSETVREQMATNALTLEHAAYFAEFEDDEAAIERLERALQFGRPLAHVAQQLRDEAAERAELLAEVERLGNEGVPVLDPDKAPTSLWGIKLADLQDAEGNPVPEESWPTIAGAFVVVTTEWEYPDTDDSDDTDYDEVADAVRAFAPVWIVPDPPAAGLHHKYDDKSAPGRDSEAESEAGREAAKVERRRVIEHNKAWRSAVSVRREWLRGFLGRKSVPTGAEALICEAVVGCDHHLGKALDKRHPLLRSLLGEDEDGFYESAAACARMATGPKTPKALSVRTLAAVLAAWEESAGVHTWRNPTEWDARVMGALIGWGYEASEVERILIGEEPTTDDAT